MADERLYAADNQLWQNFVDAESLTVEQIAQFKRYTQLLTDWNERMNLTAITDLADIIDYHFKDSLALGHIIDLQKITMIADVGTGAGFPGIPLKIVYPHLHVILIEVVQKKVKFLQAVIQDLGLTNIEVVSVDWLTFLRTSMRPVNLFCARASLAPELLVSMFAKWSGYKKAKLVYWAANSWEKTAVIVPFLEKEVSYTVGQKNRKLVFFRFPGRAGKRSNVRGHSSNKGSA